MLLSKELVKRRFSEIINENYNFLFLDVKSLNNQTEKIEMAIEVLGLINETNRIKSICKNLNSNIEIDERILYNVIMAIYSETPLSDEDLLKYITLICQLNKIFDIVSGLSEIETTLPGKIDYFIFGLGFDEQNNLSKEDYIELEDKFYDAILNNYKKEEPKYITLELKRIISEVLKKANPHNLNAC